MFFNKNSFLKRAWVDYLTLYFLLPTAVEPLRTEILPQLTSIGANERGFGHGWQWIEQHQQELRNLGKK